MIERSVLCAVCAGCVIALTTEMASAQGRPFGKIRVTIGQGYDDNLFASPASGNPRSDLITRIGPIFEGGYQSPALALLTSYGFDAEKYIHQVQLNDTLARQDARMELRYKPVPRLSLQAVGSYLNTQTPRELNLATTLLPAGRARAQRLRARSGFVYDANAVMKVSGDYERAADAIEGGLATIVHSSRLSVSYRPSPRNSFRTDYRFTHIGFEDDTTILSSAITGGWSRTLTPFTTLEIDVGPRMSSGAIRPELAALIRHRLRRGGEATVGYFATEETTLGELGTVQVQRVQGTVLYVLSRVLSIRVSPAGVRSLRQGLPVTVYELDGDVTIKANARLAFVVDAHFGQQNGTFNSTPDVIPYRGVNFKTIVTLE